MRYWSKKIEGESQPCSCQTTICEAVKCRDKWPLAAVNIFFSLRWVLGDRNLVIIGCVAILLFIYNYGTEKIKRNGIGLSAGVIENDARQYASAGCFSYPTPSLPSLLSIHFAAKLYSLGMRQPLGDCNYCPSFGRHSRRGTFPQFFLCVLHISNRVWHNCPSSGIKGKMKL